MKFPITSSNWFARRTAKPSCDRKLPPENIIEPLEARIAPATIVVTSLADDFIVDGKVTLAEAIKAANTDTSIDGSVAGNGSDLITFAPALTTGGPATIHLTSLFAATPDDRSGLGATDFGPTAFKIGTNITIQGPTGDNGITIQRDTGSAEFRLFYVTSAGSLALDHLTLTGGVAHGGNGAGSIAAGGGGAGGLGGAIFSQGALDVKNSTLSGNQAIGGNGIGSGGFLSGGAGGGGVGASAPSGNSVSPAGTAGGGPNAGFGANGSDGGAGGMGGGGAGGANGFSPGNGFSGGGGGFGGGGGGGGAGLGGGSVGGTAGLGGFGGGGGGGGRGQGGATGGVGVGSLFGGGLGGNGAAGGGGGGGGGGGAGLGGAIFNDGGTVNLVDSTFSGNTAQGGNGGSISTQGAGGSGLGGGLFNLDGSVTVLNSTFADNTVTAGNNGTPGHDGGAIYSLDQHGSGLPVGTALVHIQNTIVANSINATKDFVNNAGLVTGDHNLVESNTGVAAGVIATTADPLLGALAANGGPTKTYALKPGSPAREAGGLTDEIQKVTVAGVAGTFTLTFNGQTTAALAFNATGAQVQTALNALSTIGGVGGAVTVAQNGNQYSVVFGGTLANLNEPTMTTSGVGGAVPSVATLLDGGALPAATDQRGITRSLDGDNSGSATVDIGAFEAPNPFQTVNLAAGAGPWTVKLVGNQVEVFNNAGNVIFNESKDALTLLQINGTIADDTVIVDSSNGLVALPGVVAFDGAGGFNTLQLVQPGSATPQTSDTFSVGPATGEIHSVIVGPSGTQDVRAYNLAPVIDTVPAALLTVNGTNAANTISYTAGSVAANGLVAVDEFETIEFSNKTALTLNGLGGEDAISLNNPSLPTGLTGITVNGGDPAGVDRVIIVSKAGTAENLAITPTVAGAASVAGGLVPVTFTGMSQLFLEGQSADGDKLIWNDTNVNNPNNTLTVRPGPTDDSGSASGFKNGVGGFTFVPAQWTGFTAFHAFQPTIVSTLNLLIVEGTVAHDEFDIEQSSNVTDLAVTVNQGPEITSGAQTWVLRGLEGDDFFFVTMSQTGLAPSLGIEGGGGTDGFLWEGVDTKAEDFLVDLDTPGSGRVTVNTQSASYDGIEELLVWGEQADLDTLKVNDDDRDNTWEVSSGAFGDFLQIDAHESIEYESFSTVTFVNNRGEDLVRIHPTLLKAVGPTIVTPLANPAQTQVELIGTGIADNVTATATTISVNGKSITFGDANTSGVTVSTLAGNDVINLTSFTAAPVTIHGGDGADTLSLTLATAGTTTLVPGVTPDAGTITSPGGTTTFSGIELVGLTGAAGANTLNLQGTHASDTMAVQFLGGANRAWINDRAVVSFANFATVNVNGLFGDDKFSIAPAGLVGVTAINVAGGDPSASDELVVTGTAAADTFTFIGTSASAGSVALTGAPAIAFTTTENVLLDGLAGADTFRLASAKGAVQIRGGDDSDTVDFTGATAGVVFDLDAVGVDQHVNTTGEIVTLADLVENFIGTAFNDVLRVKAAPFARTVFGGVQSTLPPGDTLIFDGNGAVVITVPVDSNTGTIKTIGYADLTYDEFETKSLNNSPSGPGGFGTPSNSDAFSTAHIYDSLLFKNGGKPAPGKGPTAVATGDLNGDGFADMVVANSKSKNLSILINVGNGTFLDPVNISTGKASPQDVVLGDFDGDGNLDAVISLPTLGGISFFKGDGAGGFAIPTTATAPKFKPFALSTGDLNGDGDLDIVAVSKATNAVVVLLGNGAGVFTAGAPVKTLGKNSIDVVVADFNGDGDLDVATANVSSNNISFLAGDGTGALGAAARFGTGLQPTSLTAADLDNDGDLDLAVSNAVSRFVSVLLGNGTAPAATQFAPQLRVAVPGLHQSTSIVTGDIDGDGLIDLGLGNRAGVNFTVLRGLGAGAYSQPYEFNLGKDPAFGLTGGTALADFNNDGLLDIVATSLARNDVRVLLHKA